MNDFNHFYFEQRQKLPYIFGYAKRVAWDKRKLEELAQSYGSLYEEVDEALKIYAEDTLQIDNYQQYKTCNMCFLAFFTKEEKTTEEKENAYTYYERYAPTFEKTQFQEFIKDILAKYKKKIIANEDAAGYLKEWSINLYDLYCLVNIVPGLSIYQNILIKQAKEYYDLCFSVDFDDQEIEKLAFRYQMNSEQFLTLANLYSKNILYFDLFTQAHLFSKNHYSNKSYEVLDSLVDEEDGEKIQRAFLAANIGQQDISVFCYCYHRETELKVQQALEKKFLEQLKMLHQKKVDKISHINHLRAVPYEPYFQEYIKGTLSLNEFLEQKKIIKPTFLNKLRKCDDADLVLKVKEKMNQEKENSINYIGERCRKIISYLTNGYPDRNGKRKFTLFDYFALYSDLHLEDINITVLPLTSSEKKVLNKFLAPLKTCIAMSKETVLQLKLEFHSEKDKDGFPIKGTGIVVSEEELGLIADYLTSHNIPLFDSIVNVAAREYVDGNLVIDPLQKR